MRWLARPSSKLSKPTGSPRFMQTSAANRMHPGGDSSATCPARCPGTSSRPWAKPPLGSHCKCATHGSSKLFGLSPGKWLIYGRPAVVPRFAIGPTAASTIALKNVRFLLKGFGRRPFADALGSTRARRIGRSSPARRGTSSWANGTRPIYPRTFAADPRTSRNSNYVSIG